jgi:hypothetical protein
VLSVAAAGLLVPYTTGVKVRAEGIARTMAMTLASDLMEKVIKMTYNQIAPMYNNYTENAGQVKDATGAVYTDTAYARFSRSCTCDDHIRVAQEGTAGGYKYTLVTVKVFYDGREMVTLKRLITKWD